MPSCGGYLSDSPVIRGVPAAPPLSPVVPGACRTRRSRLHNLSKNGLISRVEQGDGHLPRGRRQMHVPHRRRQVRVPGELLDGLGRRSAHRQMRAERVAQDMDAAGGSEPGSPLRRLDQPRPVESTESPGYTNGTGADQRESVATSWVAGDARIACTVATLEVSSALSPCGQTHDGLAGSEDLRTLSVDSTERLRPDDPRPALVARVWVIGLVY
jgi:hypothetical protein